MCRPFSCFLAVALALAVGGEVRGGFVVNGDLADGTVDVNGLPQDFALTQLRAGVGGNDLRGLAIVYFFELPTLPSLDALTGAQLRLGYLGLTQATVFAAPNFNADLFGLGARSTPTILSSDYHDGPATGSADTLLVQGLTTPTTAAGALNVTGAGFLDYVKGLYNADGTPTAAFAVFRINPDIDLPVGSGQYRGYEFASGDNPNAALVPQLQLEVNAVPEPSGLAQMSGTLAFGPILTAYRLRQRRMPAG